MHIEIYIHAKKEAGLLPEGFEKVIDKVAMSASRKLMEKGHVSDDSSGVIELNLMSNEQIAEINKRLRGKEGPTDVISLRLSDPEEVMVGFTTFISPRKSSTRGVAPCVGEIYISLEKCALQAEEIGQSFLEELSFLLVHGILHIFGYDHQASEEEAEMTKTAYEILGRD